MQNIELTEFLAFYFFACFTEFHVFFNLLLLVLRILMPFLPIFACFHHVSDIHLKVGACRITVVPIAGCRK